MTSYTSKTDNTQRFTGKVENYIKYRPGYPGDFMSLLTSQVGFSSDWLVADVGSGTGILSKVFLEAGSTVYGIEPNRDMREAGEKLLSHYPRFKSIAASAENTILPDRSVDLVTAGQAFHWFDPEQAKMEFCRILRPGGSVVLVWNSDREGEPFWQDYEVFLLEHGTDYKELKAKGVEDDKKINEFFGGKFVIKNLKNFQDFDLDGFTGRFLSISHAPTPQHPGFISAIKSLRELFERHQKDGRLRMEYDTKVYFGQPCGLSIEDASA